MEKRDANTAERYRELAIYAADEAVLETTVLILWGYAGNLSARKIRLLLRKLASKGLLQQETETAERKITLHDLQHDYLRAIQILCGDPAPGQLTGHLLSISFSENTQLLKQTKKQKSCLSLQHSHL